MKKQLIKELDHNGKVWYYTRLKGIKVTPYTNDEKTAIEEFNAAGTFEPSTEVIMEEEVNND